MNRTSVKFLFLAAFILFFIGTFHFSIADDDAKYLICFTTHESNPVYEQECGTCHFAYQPELLPEASWMRILKGLNNHFGVSIILDDDPEREVTYYLRAYSAENSSAKHSLKIMGSLGNEAPLRITDIPYIRKKHNDISQDILDRESIGSLSNCSACHTETQNGIYDDDTVRIPD